MDTPLFSLFLSAHIISLVFGMGAVLVIDVIGLLWVKERVTVDFLMRSAAVTQRIIWAGWSGLVLSGIGLLTLKGYTDSLTVIKIFLVAMIGANGVVLHFVKEAAGRISRYRNMPVVYKYHVYMTAAVSQVGWWGAIAIGLLHGHWKSYISWPASPIPAVAIIAAVWLTATVIGQVWLVRYRRTRGAS